MLEALDEELELELDDDRLNAALEHVTDRQPKEAIASSRRQLLWSARSAATLKHAFEPSLFEPSLRRQETEFLGQRQTARKGAGAQDMALGRQNLLAEPRRVGRSAHHATIPLTSSASFSSLVNCTSFVCWPAADELRGRTAFGVMRLLRAPVLRRCAFVGSPPVLERRFIASP
jgi:hypothetical protein